MNEGLILRALYENRKQFIVVNYRVHGEKSGYVKSYAYAISHDLFPFFHQEYESTEGEVNPYAECYKIQRDRVSEILEYIDKEWLAGNLYTFYELESMFRDRVELLIILRYSYLSGRFNNDLWERIDAHAPSEAHSITRDIADWEI